MFSFGETTMRPIRNFMTKEEIQEDIESMTVKDKIESPAELEYQAQQYWDEREYDVCLDLISKSIELNPSHFSYFKRAQCQYHLHEYHLAITDLDTALQLDPEYQNALDLKELILERVKQERDYTMGIYL